MGQHGGSRGRGYKHLNNNNIYVKKYPSLPARNHSGCSSSNSDEDIKSFKRSVLDRRRSLVYSGLFLICLVVYWNALGCEFVFDDITAIVENRDLRPHVPLKNLWANDFWGTPMSKEQSHKSYRPLTVLTFRWNFWWGETDPIGYHLINVVLHGLVTCLYFRVCRQLVASSSVSLVASVLFALHSVSNGVWWCIAGSSS